jgi:16S rRNA A1518/A1519 N6-dimethyltransferase RsmA/KsgA/DIM1 with predicted DNA glycosylase/AP lyase activity
MLKNNLAGGLKIAAAEAARRLQEAGLPPAVRAEDLSLDDWRKLFAAFFDLVV